MFDAPHPYPPALSPAPAVMERSIGLCRVVLGPEGLRQLAQSGSAKAILPRTAGLPEVVFLNTSGGLTAGDSLSLSLSLGNGVAAVATTQTAERAYRAGAGPAAQIKVSLSVAAGGWMDWLPQEMILYNGAKLHRDTEIILAPGAGCLSVETLVLGRAAMGERVTHLDLRDSRTIRRDGLPIAAERLRLNDVGLARTGAAMLGNARAIATLIRIGPGDWLAPVRAALTEPGVTGAASAVGDRLVVRLAAPDLWPLDQQLRRLLSVLRPGPLPRVWQM